MTDSESIDLLDDEALLKRYSTADDREALDLLFRRHVDAAYATALSLCRNAADAEDAVQTAFVQIMKSASAYRGGRGDHGVRTWILRTVANAGKMRIRSEVRRRKREEFVVEDQDGFHTPDGPEGPDVDLREKEHEVLAALDSLPERFRSAIWLHLCQGLSRTDAAAALGLPERTLDNQVQYGMKKLRQTLATMGTSASLASLTSVLPLLPGEPAPASLVSSVGKLAHASLKALEAATSSAAKAGSGSLLFKAVAAGILVATGVGVAHYAGHARIPPASPAAPFYTSPRVSYSWDFNTPDLPPQIKVLEGDVKHVPGGGPDKKGCLQLDAKSTRLLLDVPMEALPLVVKWKSSVLVTPRDQQFISKVNLFPLQDVVQYVHVGGWPRTASIAPGQTQSAWYSHVDYFTPFHIDRWTDGSRVDLTLGRPDSNSRLMLCFKSAHQIDDLTIQSLSSNDLPNVDVYVKAIEKIPREKRIGRVPMPYVRFERPDRLGASVMVDFYENVESTNWNPLVK